jgi:hypothetical protein
MPRKLIKTHKQFANSSFVVIYDHSRVFLLRGSLRSASESMKFNESHNFDSAAAQKGKRESLEDIDARSLLETPQTIVA